jgi:acyl carrier protein
MKELLSRLERVTIDPDSLGEDVRLDSVGFDSLSILDYMYELETEFDIQMDIADLAEMEVVGDLVDHVAAKVQRKTAK